VNEHTVATINSGQVHIYEPDLDILVKAAVQSGKLKTATVPEEADIFIIAVPTPFTDNHKPDLTYVQQASKSVASFIKAGGFSHFGINKSNRNNGKSRRMDC
jgi:UDP-N-acetyl-D-mannosaminuronic acid dehydrogenase